MRLRPDAPSYQAALYCLTSAIYHEAASETLDGQRAVAQVVLNRVRHPAFPATVCGVVFQGAERDTGCQFTFTCDGSLLRPRFKPAWIRAERVAREALAGYVYKPVGHATHYHADWVLPYWADSLSKSAVVGVHIFYRWPGAWGRPAAFRQRYGGKEPVLPAPEFGVGRPADAEPDATAEPAAESHTGKPAGLIVDQKPQAVLLANEQYGRLLVGSDTAIGSEEREQKTPPSARTGANNDCSKKVAARVDGRGNARDLAVSSRTTANQGC